MSIKPISDKKLEQLQKDVEVKKVIIERADGVWYPSSYHKGILINVRCVGGKCEKCGKSPCAPSYELHNHELIYRSQGGKVTEANSQMWCDTCHRKEHNHEEANNAV